MGCDERERHCYALVFSPPAAANVDYILILLSYCVWNFLSPNKCFRKPIMVKLSLPPRSQPEARDGEGRKIVIIIYSNAFAKKSYIFTSTTLNIIFFPLSKVFSTLMLLPTILLSSLTIIL